MDQKDSKKLFFHFLLGAGLFLFAMGMIVFLADPFFHYHSPWFGLAAVQDEKEYQVPGVLAHVDHDSVLFGSSTVMSINTDVLDERFSCKTVKAVGNSASAPYLNECLRRAFDAYELKYVFYAFEVFAFYTDPDMNVFPKDVRYLTNSNPFDDVKYLWNGEVIGKKIPDMIRTTRAGNYSWGTAYNFNQYGELGPEAVFSYWGLFERSEIEQLPWDYELDIVEENVRRLEEVVAAHPETEFLFFLPPYSIIWWDRAYLYGELDSYEHTLKFALEVLLQHDNVRAYTTFFNSQEVITDMYLYMDGTHAGPEVTDRMAMELGNEDIEITLDNYEEEVDALMELYAVYKERVEQEGYAILYQPGGMQ